MNPGEYGAMFAVEDHHWWYVAVRREVERWLGGIARGATRPARILDAGSGTGGLLANLRTRAWKVGLEVSSEGIRLARSRRAGGAFALVQGNVSALPFADDSFDGVISIDVLCHAGVEERQALEEVVRVLRPGGRVIVQVPAFQWLYGEHDAAVWSKRRYRREQVAGMLSDAGLATRRCRYRNSLLFPAAAVARLFARGRRSREGARSDVRPVPRALNAVLSGVLALERRLRIRFPFGLSVFAVGEKPLVSATE